MTVQEELLIWVAVVLSCALAIAMPVLAWRRLRRPETLREAWMYSRPGSWVAVCVTGIVLLGVIGVMAGFAALAFPFLWATVALIGGCMVATAWFLVRYLTFDPSIDLLSLAEAADEKPPA